MPSTSSTRPVGDAVGRGQHPQVVAGLAGRVERLGLQQRTDVAHRLVEGGERPAVERAWCPAPWSRPSISRMVVDLPAPFGPEEAGHAARTHVERQVPDTAGLPPYVLLRPRASITAMGRPPSLD